MRTVIAALTLLALALAAWTVLSGGDRVILAWAMEGQQQAQAALAGALRALRTGEPGAIIGLLTICFVYGFFHAVGPGHGKVLIGGYGLATRVTALRLSLVALVASLAQAVTAIALVGVGLWLLGWGREDMTVVAERFFAPLSFAAISAVGLWLAWRGTRVLHRERQVAYALAPAGSAPHGHHHHHHHDHAHDHTQDDGLCPSCGHAHAPPPDAVAAAKGLRDYAALIGAVALRPCTGALFVLILTAQLDIFAAGVAGTFAMALGTAAVTVLSAIAATTARDGLFLGWTETAALVRVQGIVQVVAGLGIAIVAGQLAMNAL